MERVRERERRRGYWGIWDGDYGGGISQREKVAEVLLPARAGVFLIRLGGMRTGAGAALPV